MKKFISSLICATMVFSSGSNVFASNIRNISSSTNPAYEAIRINDQVSIHMTKEEIDSKLRSLDFTNQEIEELYSRESNRRVKRSFPSNPQEGDTYTSSFKISNADLGLPLTVAGGVVPALAASKSAIAKKIISKFGLGAVSWATLVAGSIAAYMNDKRGFSGFTATIDWRYGLTNDLIMGWSVGPINVNRY